MSQAIDMIEGPITPRRSTRLKEKATASSPMTVAAPTTKTTHEVFDLVSRATQTEVDTCDRGVQVVSLEIDQMIGADTSEMSVLAEARKPPDELDTRMVVSPIRTTRDMLGASTPKKSSARSHRKESTPSPGSFNDEPRTPSSMRGQMTSEHLFLTPTPLMSPSVQRSLKMLAATPVRSAGQPWAARTPDLTQNRRPMGTASRSTPRRSYAERTRCFDEEPPTPIEQLSSARERRQARHPGSTPSSVYSWLADKEKRATAMLKSAMRDIAQRKKQESVRERRVSWGSLGGSSPMKRRRIERISTGSNDAAVRVASSSRSLLMVAAALKTGQERETAPVSPMARLQASSATDLSSPSRSPTSSMTRLSLLSPRNDRGRTP